MRTYWCENLPGVISNANFLRLALFLLWSWAGFSGLVCVWEKNVAFRFWEIMLLMQFLRKVDGSLSTSMDWADPVGKELLST